MSKSEELLRLERDLDEQPELREKLEAEIKRIAETKEAESDGEAMVKAAAALGYTITLEELERATADLEKLDDDELDAAGGARKKGKTAEERLEERVKNTERDEYHHRLHCNDFWHCYIVTLHTETAVKNVACWSNHSCAIISEKIPSKE